MRNQLAGMVLAISLLATLGPVSRAAAIPGDFNNDGTVGLDDLVYFVKQFSSCKSGGSWDSACNLDGAGALTHSDAQLMVEDYLQGAVVDSTATLSLSTASDWIVQEGASDIEWTDAHVRLKEQNTPHFLSNLAVPSPQAGVYFVDDDQHLLIAGNLYCNSRWLPYLAKVDLKGNVIFQKDYCDNINLGYSYYDSIMLGYNNGIIQVKTDPSGSIYAPVRPARSSNYDLGICKFTSSGAVQWCSFMNTFDYDPAYGSDAGDERSYDAAVYAPDNAAYMFGRGPNLQNFVIARFDATTGARQWVTWYQNPGNDECWTGAVDSTGNPIAAGYVDDGAPNKNLGILKLSPSGNVLWFRDYDPGGGWDVLRGIRTDKDDSVLASGNPGVIKYDKYGNLKWFAYFGFDATRMELDRFGNAYSFYGGMNKVSNATGELQWSFHDDVNVGDACSGSIGKSGLIAAAGSVYRGGFALISQGYAIRATLVCKNPILYRRLTSFSADIPSYSLGCVSFQLSPDGQKWYYYDGSKWSQTSAYDANSADAVNAHLTEYSDIFHDRSLYIKIILDSQGGDYSAELSSLSICYKG